MAATTQKPTTKSETKLWQPHSNNKPQQEAYKCNARWLAYGGAAGGGKSDLALGKLITKHKNAVIYRRENTQIKDLRTRAAEIINDNEKGLNKVEGTYKHSNGKILNFASMQYEDDKKKYQGRARDGIAFDEATEFTRSQVQYVTIWNRSADPKQHCQVVMTFNPPQDIEGEWVIDFFAPWLDEDFDGYGGRADSGEIRYAYVKENDDGTYTDVWVDSEGQHIDANGKTYQAESRCFIAARVEDNPYMMDSGYDKVLDSLPDELRDSMRFGIMRRALKDNALQVIPREWVRLAQQRWQEAQDEPKVKLTSLGVDVSRGGKDSTIIYKRYGNWWAMPIEHKGIDTDDGPKVAGLVLPEIVDNARVSLDVIGVGTSVYDSLKANYDNVNPVNGSNSSDMLDRSGKFKMRNKRAELWWKLREALDPVHGDGLMLPPSPTLLKDLTAPRYKVQVSGIQIEDKKEVKKRLGRSPDHEAIIYSLDEPEVLPNLETYNFL